MAEALRSRPDQRVLLSNASWETYERLLAEREDAKGPRFFYDRGVLEILSPSAEHESISSGVAQLLPLLAEEVGFGLFAVGSATFRRRDLDRGFEPDQSFYLGDRAGPARLLVTQTGAIRLDRGDPPPDLVFEVDLTSPSLDKLPIYARLGIAEVWRYVGGERRTEILVLGDEPDRYDTADRSQLLPYLTADRVSATIRRAVTTDPSEWMPDLRAWARSLP